VDKVDNFMIDRLRVRDYETVEMFDGSLRVEEIRALAGVAAYLCSALEALTADGCDWLVADVRDILGAIERRISLLESVGRDASS
jgi:hypothetical protein